MFSRALDRSYQLHRWFGFILALPILAWCLSGIAYVFAPSADSNPAPAYHNYAAGIEQSRIRSYPHEFLTQEEQSRIIGLAIITIADGIYYQLEFSHQPGFHYYNASNGVKLKEGEGLHAAAIGQMDSSENGQLSSVRLGPIPESIRHLRFPHEIGSDLLSVSSQGSKHNRYVDLRSGRILGETDALERRILGFIYHFHHMGWLGGGDSIIRRVIVAAASLSVVLLGIAGLVVIGNLLRMGIKPSHKRRKLHRLLGVVLLVPLIIFGWSGFQRILSGNLRPIDQAVLQTDVLERMSTGVQLERLMRNVSLGSFSRLDIIQFEGGDFYRVFSSTSATDGTRPDSDVRIINAATLGPVQQGQQRHAESLFRSAVRMGNFAQPRTHSLQLINEFSNEYPAFHRVLPIYRGVSLDSGFRERYPVFYIDPIGNRLIHLSTHAFRKSEGRFNFLHLYAFLDNATLRQGAQLLFSIGIIVLALLGITNAMRLRSRKGAKGRSKKINQGPKS